MLPKKKKQKQPESLVEMLVFYEKGQGSHGHTPPLAGKAEVLSDLHNSAGWAHTTSKRMESFCTF